MKTRFILVLITLLVVFYKEANSNTVLTSSGDTQMVASLNEDTLFDTGQQQACIWEDSYRVGSSKSNSDEVSAFTLAANTVNNGFTVVTEVVGILTLVVALFGLFGYLELKKKVAKAIKEAKILKEKNENIEKKQILNNQYLQKINEWILDNADTIAETNGSGSELGKNLKNKSMINYNMMKLYLSTDEKEILECFNYIKMKGTLNEIDPLQFIVDNDPNKYKSDKASEAIGYIRARI